MSKSPKDLPFPLDLVFTQIKFTKWIYSCDTHEQLIILNFIVPDFFTEKRFPRESKNALFLASTALLLDIENRIRDLELSDVKVKDRILSIQKAY